MSYDWKKVLIPPESSIKDALKIINDESLRVALVVDEYQHLIGVVTDGDIRRGLLNDFSLSDLVSLVMNSSPTTALIGTSRKKLIELMEEKVILSIPLLDNNRKVVGLENYQDNEDRKKRYQHPVFIMAGGFGTRLRPMTNSCPKPMLKVGGRPILETVIQSFIKAGFENFYISTHYMPEQIHEYFGDGTRLGINITYVYEENPLGTGGAIGLLPSSLTEKKVLPLIVMNGDVLTNVDFEKLLDFHENENADATMCVQKYEYQIPYGVVKSNGNKVFGMIEKPIQSFFVNAGIYIISPNIIKTVPKNHRIDMPSLLEKEIEKNSKVLMFPIHEYWLDIGRIEDFNRAQKDVHTLGVL